MEKNLTGRNIRKLYLKLLPVQIFIQISSSLSSLVNGSIVGNNLTAVDMSALGLITPYTTIFAAIASIFSGGMGIICGNLMGKGDTRKINVIYSVCINLSAVTGLAGIILTLLLKNNLAILLGASGETLASTVSYLIGICLGVLPMLLLPCLMTFLQMSNESSFSLIATILLAIFNALFDLADIYVLKAGVFGVGLASSLSYYIVVLIIWFYIHKKQLAKYSFKEFAFADIRQITVYGFPFALAAILYSVRNIFINNLSQAISGVVALNALAILSSVSGFFDSFNIGAGAAYRMLASVYVGEKDPDSLKKLFRNGLFISEIIIFVKVAVLIILGDQIAMAFGAGGDTIAVTSRLLFLYALSSPFNVPTIYLLSTNLAFGRSAYCNFIYLINAFIAPLICCYLGSQVFGLDAIFSCYYISEIVTLICIFAVAIIKNKKVVLSFEELFSLPEGFGSEDKFFKSVNSLKETVNTSMEVEEFCLKHQTDAKKAKYAGLCVEEMMGNIVEHGFNKDSKKHAIDLFVSVENDNVLIRIKDDCVPFDPNTRVKIYNPEDPCKNVGIRLVSKLASQMNYQSTFGMNVLTISF